MPHDPYESCWGCPKPRPCDRSACDGWKRREENKAIEYAARERAQAAVPDHAGYKKILRDRQRRDQKRGR